MIKNKLNTLIIILFSFFLYSCESVKEGLQGKKRSEQSDEFLVEKKNPLALPPDYDKLPTPGNEEVSPETFSEDNEVKDILDIQDSSTSTEVNKDTLDVESTIIEKIQ
tara:strand:- start:1032 stop:1355 length:324 start_codon:yes stop_codon:yes gene_type:complete